MPRKSRKTKWKCSRNRPLKIGKAVIRVSRDVTVTVTGEELVKRLPNGIDAADSAE